MSIICEFCDTRIKKDGNLNEEQNKHIQICERQQKILREGKCICSTKKHKGSLIMHLKTHFKEESKKESSPNNRNDYYSDKSSDFIEKSDNSGNEDDDDGIPDFPDFEEDVNKETPETCDTPNGMFYNRVP